MKAQNKYELTDEIEVVNGVKHYRIRALRDIPEHGVRKGALGGFVLSDKNLSQTGAAWIGGEAVVTDDALVADDALVTHRAQVKEHASVLVNAKVFNYALVTGFAKVLGNAHVYDRCIIDDDAVVTERSVLTNDAHVYGRAHIKGMCHVEEDASVHGHALISENAQITGDADVAGETVVHGRTKLDAGTLKSNDDFVCVDSVGSRHDTCTYNIVADIVTAGCFSASLKEFERRVKVQHGNNKYAKEYARVIAFFKACRDARFDGRTVEDTENEDEKEVLRDNEDCPGDES